MDNCVAFANFQPCVNLLTILPEKEHPVQKFVYDLCPKAYNELLEVLSIMWDFAEHDNHQAFEQKNNYLQLILTEVQNNYQKLDLMDLKLQLQCHGQNRPLATFEQQIIKLADDFQKSQNENLKLTALCLMFLERVLNQKQCVALALPGSPLVLGAGEYLAVDFSGDLLGYLNQNFCEQQKFDIRDSFSQLKMLKSGTEIKSDQMEVEIGFQEIKVEGVKIKYHFADDKLLKMEKFDGKLFQLSGGCEIQGRKQIVPFYGKVMGDVECRLMKGMMEDQIAMITVE